MFNLKERFKRLKHFFTPKMRNKIKLTTNGIPLPDKELTLPDVLREKCKNGEKLTLSEINLYLSDVMDVPSLKSVFFKLRGTYAEEMVFEIQSVTMSKNEEGKHLLHVELSEQTFGFDMTLRVSCFDIHEVLAPCEINM